MEIIEKYKNKSWLEFEYCWNKRSQSEIAKLCNISQTTILNWMKKFNIPTRTTSETSKGHRNAMYGRKHSQETKKVLSDLKKGKYNGEDNPAWKGDNVGYGALHRWIKKIKPQPNKCEKCGKTTKDLELSNNGIYNRDPNNYEYLCYKCHKIKDGTIYNIKHQEGLYGDYSGTGS